MPRGKRGCALLHEPVDANIRLRAAMLLAKQSWYQGRHADLIALPALARIEPGRAGVQPYGRLLEGLMRQYVAWAGADWPAGLRCTHEALTVADEVGIHLLDAHLRLHGACFAALRGDDAQARAWLDAVAGQADPARRMEAWHHFTVRGWLALRGGDAAAAEAASRVAIDAAQAMGPDPHAMALALRCHALQTLDDAPALRTAQRELVALADATENRLAALHLHLLNAHTAAGSGDRDGCLRQLRQALRVARACALWAPIGIEPRATAALLNEAIAAGVERDAACRLARAMRPRHRRKPACTGRGRCGCARSAASRSRSTTVPSVPRASSRSGRWNCCRRWWRWAAAPAASAWPICCGPRPKAIARSTRWRWRCGACASCWAVPTRCRCAAAG